MTYSSLSGNFSFRDRSSTPVLSAPGSSGDSLLNRGRMVMG